MALIEPTRKGGRYTKKEQEERKLQVYQLHFEENKSAVQISEILRINRNTINKDIKFWHNQELNKDGLTNIIFRLKNLIQRLEIQRERFFEYLEDASNLNEKLRVEKTISDLDNRLAQFYSKAIFSGKENLETTIKTNNIKEEEVKDFVRYLILGYIDRDYNWEMDWQYDMDYSENELKFEFIKKTKSNVEYANKIIKKMHEFGLSLCKNTKFTLDKKERFDIKEFASLRGYLSKREYNIKTHERKLARKKEKSGKK